MSPDQEARLTMFALVALYFFLVFFNIAGEFLVNTAGFALPAYWSMEAIFTMGKADDTQWLTVCSTPSNHEVQERVR